MASGVCAMCRCGTKEIQDSHIIPRSFFRNISKRNSGKSIKVPAGSEEHVGYTIESWSEFLLCSECEGKLNKTYENDSIPEFAEIKKYESTAWLSTTNSERLRTFFLSIIWRAHISTLDFYSNVKVDEEKSELIRKLLLQESFVDEKIFSVKLSKLIDSAGSISEKEMGQFITSPFARPSRQPSLQSEFFLVLNGVLVECRLAKHTFKEKASGGVIQNRIKMVKIPLKEFTEVKEIFNMGVRAISKVEHKQVSPKIMKRLGN